MSDYRDVGLLGCRTIGAAPIFHHLVPCRLLQCSSFCLSSYVHLNGRQFENAIGVISRTDNKIAQKKTVQKYHVPQTQKTRLSNNRRCPERISSSFATSGIRFVTVKDTRFIWYGNHGWHQCSCKIQAQTPFKQIVKTNRTSLHGNRIRQHKETETCRHLIGQNESKGSPYLTKSKPSLFVYCVWKLIIPENY